MTYLNNIFGIIQSMLGVLFNDLGNSPIAMYFLLITVFFIVFGSLFYILHNRKI